MQTSETTCVADEAGRGLQAVADGFAEFLKFGSRNGMTKQALGEYLGERDDLSEAVLRTYARLFDFQGVGLVSALREFLESFKLPGESQKIERITEAFAQARMEWENVLASEHDYAGIAARRADAKGAEFFSAGDAQLAPNSFANRPPSPRCLL